jgi:hypothetical protein
MRWSRLLQPIVQKRRRKGADPRWRCVQPFFYSAICILEHKALDRVTLSAIVKLSLSFRAMHPMTDKLQSGAIAGTAALHSCFLATEEAREGYIPPGTISICRFGECDVIRIKHFTLVSSPHCVQDSKAALAVTNIAKRLERQTLESRGIIRSSPPSTRSRVAVLRNGNALRSRDFCDSST